MTKVQVTKVAPAGSKINTGLTKAAAANVQRRANKWVPPQRSPYMQKVTARSVNVNARQRRGTLKKQPTMPPEEVKVEPVKQKTAVELALERSANVVASCTQTMKKSEETQGKIRSVSASYTTALSKFNNIKAIGARIEQKMAAKAAEAS